MHTTTGRANARLQSYKMSSSVTEKNIKNHGLKSDLSQISEIPWSLQYFSPVEWTIYPLASKLFDNLISNKSDLIVDCKYN